MVPPSEQAGYWGVALARCWLFQSLITAPVPLAWRMFTWAYLRTRPQFVRSAQGHFVALFEAAEDLNQVPGSRSSLDLHPLRLPVADTNHKNALGSSGHG